MAGHIASNRYDPSLWFKIIDIAVKINRVESWWWIPGSILDGWTSTTKEDNSWFNDYPFLLSFFFYIPLNVTSKGYRFLKVITRRIVSIILHRNGIGPFLIFAQMKEGSLLECRLE